MPDAQYRDGSESLAELVKCFIFRLLMGLEAARASHIPAPGVTATVAPFRAWRGSRLAVAGGPTRATIDHRFSKPLRNRVPRCDGRLCRPARATHGSRVCNPLASAAPLSTAGFDQIASKNVATRIMGDPAYNRESGQGRLRHWRPFMQMPRVVAKE
jgi:hypothetical protein